MSEKEEAKSNFLSDILSTVPGIDEAMSFSHLMAYTHFLSQK
jgi:hypothetical protein